MAIALFLAVPIPKAIAVYEAELGFGRAATLINQGQYLESLSEYQEVATFASMPEDRAKALFFMGTIYGLYLDQKEGSIRYFDRVLASYPRTLTAGESLFNKGMVLFQNGDYEDARQVFKQYLGKHPGGRHALMARVWERNAETCLLEARIQPSSPTRYTGDTTLRILIRSDVESLPVKGDPGFQCTDPVTGQILFEANQGIFSIKGGRLWVNGRDLETERCELLSRGQTITAGKAKYKGLLILYVAPGGIDVINRVGVETYLYGVVPREMPSGWPEEALKAQAVAARSYALYLKEKRLNEPFDLTATTASQVYGGYDETFSKAIRAVDDTRGQVLTHDGKLALTYYHSNSGGYTEDAGNVWVADMPYLKGGADPFSSKSPGTRWECSLKAAEIQQAMLNAGLDVGKVTGLRLLDATTSGRVRTVRIMSDSGALSLNSNSFRLKMDPARVRSTRFAITNKDDVYLFKGTGYGHGVGMSQWGARNMALENKTYQNILSYYYKGAIMEILDYALDVNH
ncbi:MAG: SpoIID/LytB domain-containing protein [Desulfatibacillum sp.]|nr:SpoIID/LytB domain-containing protein [Desulfatibacillum sp.]